MVKKLILTQGEKVEIPENMLKEIPYLDTLFSGRFFTECDEDGVVKTDEFDANLLKVIIRYLENKKIYKLFACLPVDQDILELLEMFRFLALVPPIDTELFKIKTILSEAPSLSLDSQNDVVKYGFALFYARGQINWKREQRLRNAIFNTINYLFKNTNKSFKPRAKYHIKKLALNCVTFTFNQYHRVLQLEVDDSLDQSDAESVQSYGGYDLHPFDCYCCDSDDSVDTIERMLGEFGFCGYDNFSDFDDDDSFTYTSDDDDW